MREALMNETEPIGDSLYSADYKRHVASVVLSRTLHRAYARAAATGGVD
jgi:CO/xanthine dehydrogenase FAD-binding subunit